MSIVAQYLRLPLSISNADGSGAPPPPPPSEGEPDESGSTTVQLRPRQVDSRGIRLTPAEEEWDKKLRAPGMVPTGRPGYPGIPRPVRV